MPKEIWTSLQMCPSGMQMIQPQVTGSGIKLSISNLMFKIEVRQSRLQSLDQKNLAVVEVTSPKQLNHVIRQSHLQGKTVQNSSLNSFMMHEER
jgi:hypothetical protein